MRAIVSEIHYNESVLSITVIAQVNKSAIKVILRKALNVFVGYISSHISDLQEIITEYILFISV